MHKQISSFDTMVYHHEISQYSLLSVYLYCTEHNKHSTSRTQFLIKELHTHKYKKQNKQINKL